MKTDFQTQYILHMLFMEPKLQRKHVDLPGQCIPSTNSIHEQSKIESRRSVGLNIFYFLHVHI